MASSASANIAAALAAVQQLVDRKNQQAELAQTRTPAIPAAPTTTLAPKNTVPDIGLPEDEENAFQWLVKRESGGRTNAKNPKSSAFGLGQLIRGNRIHIAKQLGIANPDTTDYAEQRRMMDYYVKGRYGSYKNAVKFWQQHHWY